MKTLLTLMLQNDEHEDPAYQGFGHEDPPPEETKPEGDDKPEKIKIPELVVGALPDLSEFPEEKHGIVEANINYDSSGRRLLPGQSVPMTAVVMVATSGDGVQFVPFKPATTYTRNYLSNAGHGYRHGARDLVTFHSQQYGYSRIEIAHGFVHQDNDRLSTYAKTTFDVSSFNGFSARRLTKADYLRYCRSLHLSVDDSSRESFWQYDIIVSAKQYYSGTLNFGVETLKENDVLGSKEAVDMTTSNLDIKEPVVRFQLFFVGHSERPGDVANEIRAARMVAEDGPYKDLMSHAESHCRLPSVTHMLNHVDCDFRTPDTEVQRFKDSEERCARLAYGTREEEAYQTALIALASKRPRKAFAVDIQIARVHHPLTHKEYRSHCVIIIPYPTDLDLMPKIGESAQILTNIPVIYEESPKPVALTEKQVVKILTNAIFTAAKYSQKARGSNEVSRSYLLSELDKLVCLPLAKEHEKYRHQFVMNSAEELRLRQGEKNDDGTHGRPETFEDHRKRIVNWVEQNLERLNLPKKDNAAYAQFNVTRQSSISGLEGCMVFHAEYPRDPLWSSHPKPYVDVDFPFVPMAAGSDIMATYRTNPKRFSFMATIVRTATEDTLKSRLAGITYATLVNSEDDQSHGYLDWLLDFSGKGVPHKLYELFNSLAHLRDRILGKPAHESAFYSATPHLDPVNESSPATNLFTQQVTFTEEESNAMLQIYHSLDEDQKSLFEKLQSPAYGDLLVSGCPGSGKTYCVGLLALLACQSRVSAADWSNVCLPTKKKPTKESDSPDTDEGVGRYDADITLQEPPNYLHPRDISRQPEPEDNQDITAQPGDGTDDGAAPDIGNKGKDDKQRGFYRVNALVLGTQNDQLDDLAVTLHNLQKKHPLRQLTITRAVPPGRLDRSLRDYERTPTDIVEDVGIPIDETFETALEFERLHKRARDQSQSMLKTDFSVHFQVATLLEENRLEDAQEANRLLLRREHISTGFHGGSLKKDLRRLLNKLVKFIYARSDLILATPFVANSLVHKLEHSPAVIWIDEAWRMTEPDALIALAGFPRALIRLQSGDIEQLKPFCATLHSGETDDKDRWLVNQFARQLATPLAKRATQSGHDVVYLRTNWRATNALSCWPSEAFYAGHMSEGNCKDTSPEMDRVDSYLTNLKPNVMGNRLVFDIYGADETRVGNSFENKVHGVFVRELIASIFANRLCSRLPTAETEGQLMSIMVISPYSQQVQLLKSHVGQLVSSEWDSRLVDFRTVDSSMGSEADIVIYSNPRTFRPGFTAESDRMNVAHTRARKLEFVIMSGRIAGGTSRRNKFVRDFWNDVEAQNAVVKYDARQWELCFRCLQKHDPVERCSEQKCTSCGQAHHVRRCKLAKRIVPAVPAGSTLPNIGEDSYTKFLKTT